MFIPRIAEWQTQAGVDLDGPPQAEIEKNPPVKKRPRRGATAMEYLVVASFILVVVISAVQYFGSKTNQLMDESATATKPNTGP